MLVLLFIATVTSLLLQARPGLIYLTVGTAAMAAMLLPFVVRHDVDMMSPWTIAAATVVVSTLIRGMYITVGWPDRAAVEALFTFDAPATELVWPAALFLGGLLLTAVGYASRRTDRTPFRVRRIPKLSTKSMWGVAVAGALISLVAFAAFVAATGGLDLSRLSAKRANELAEAGHGSLGVLRWLSKLGGLTYLLLVAHLMQQRRISIRAAAAAGFILLTAVLLPLYASSRTEALWVIILTVMIAYYSGKVTRRQLVVGLVVFLFLFDAMTYSRSARDEVKIDDLISTRSDAAAAVDSFILNRNMVDFSKSARIINNVPDVLPYERGASIGVWAVAWIPKEIWPSKPAIHSGTELGNTLFHTRRSGVPPGLYGELYWNFGILGILLGAPAFGWILGRTYERFRVRDSSTPFEMVLYCYGISRLAYYVMGTSIGFGFFRALLECLQVLALGLTLRLIVGRVDRTATS